MKISNGNNQHFELGHEANKYTVQIMHHQFYIFQTGLPATGNIWGMETHHNSIRQSLGIIFEWRKHKVLGKG